MIGGAGATTGMGTFFFQFGRDRGQPSRQPGGDPQFSSADLVASPGRGAELRNLEISDPAIFSVAGLDARSAERWRALNERLAPQIGEETDGRETFHKLAVRHLKIVDDAATVLKALLPDQRSRWSGEYYSTTRLDGIRRNLPQVETFLGELAGRAGALAQGEQPRPALQRLAVEIGRDAGEFVAQCRVDAQTLQAVSLREYPRGSLMDTVEAHPNGQVVAINDPSGYLIFQNQEIVRVHLRSHGEFPQRFHTLPVGCTDDGRHVLQQSGMLGCVGAATNMVLMDFGRPPDLERQYSSHFDNDDAIVRTLARAGLRGEVLSVPTRYFPRPGEDSPARELEAIENQIRFLERITAPGKGVLFSLSSEIGGHQIVLDRFSMAEGRATVRDPLHGWSIDVPPASILRRVGGTVVVVTDPRRE